MIKFKTYAKSIKDIEDIYNTISDINRSRKYLLKLKKYLERVELNKNNLISEVKKFIFFKERCGPLNINPNELIDLEERFYLENID